jgi:hypothetical protein
MPGDLCRSSAELRRLNETFSLMSRFYAIVGRRQTNRRLVRCQARVQAER